MLTMSRMLCDADRLCHHVISKQLLPVSSTLLYMPAEVQALCSWGVSEC